MIAARALQQNGEKTNAATSGSMPPRTLFTYHLPPGMLHVDISKPDDETQGRVWVSVVKPFSPCLGLLQVGDWLESINGYLLAGKGLSYAAQIIRLTSLGPRYLQVSRPPAVNPTIKSADFVNTYTQMVVQDKESSNNRTTHTATTQDPVESTHKLHAQKIVQDKENSNNHTAHPATIQDRAEPAASEMHAQTAAQDKENSNNCTTRPATRTTQDPVESTAPKMHAQTIVQDKENSNNHTAHPATIQDPAEPVASKMHAQTVVQGKENSNNRTSPTHPSTTEDPVESTEPKMHAQTVVQDKENSKNRTTHPGTVESTAPKMYGQTVVQDRGNSNPGITIEATDVHTESASKLYARMVAQMVVHGKNEQSNNMAAQSPAASGVAHKTYAQMVVQGSDSTTKEPVQPEAAPGVELTVLQKPTAIPVDVLLLMKEEELQLECTRRGLPSTTGGKTALLEILGVPVQQWKSWRKMKVNELKAVLRANGLKVTGKKNELLQRLGVPIGFGETQLEKSQRKMKELKRKKEPEENPKSNKKAKLGNVKAAFDPRDDPSHEEFMEACCNNPSFPAWSDPTQPVGCIQFPDGSLMEVWRCLTCGKIPVYPNAPPVEEFPNFPNYDTSFMYGGYHFPE